MQLLFICRVLERTIRRLRESDNDNGK